MCIAGAALAMSSCRSVEKATPLSSINGEWNIIEVNGSKVTPGESRTLPFIAFDTATGRVSGSSGCNRMMGSFDVNAKPGTIELGALASTRMACPDMSGERELLQVLDKVVRFEAEGEVKPVDRIVFYGTDNARLMIIERK